MRGMEIAAADSGSSSGPTSTCQIPVPTAPLDLKSTETYSFTSTKQMSVNTSQFVGRVFIPAGMTITKVSFGHTTTTTDGTYDLSLYSEDGQTRYFTKETMTLDGNGTYRTVTLDTPVDIDAGYYYF